ncbi:MAG: response regulator [Lachnospiraceae bacterium]|nr:response regulator [Lachnospiraceae bacterium]
MEATDKPSKNISVLDEYSNKVFKLVLLIVPIFFICGNITMTILHYNGSYPDINDIALWCANTVDVCYMAIAIYLIKTSYDEAGFLIPRKLKAAKMILMFMVVLQWNMNSYICPFTDFWAYAPLFVIVVAFFFDMRLVGLTTMLIIVSLLISWGINGNRLLPAHDPFFTLNLIFRGVCLVFTLLSVNIVTWFGKVFIIEAVAFREKEREMREISMEYEREVRMKSDFLANMSHEIRTPMNAVIGMAEIAMRENLPPNAVDCLTQIQKSGRNLLNIINDILDFSKIESGKMEIVPERYEPSSELNDISNVLATRVGDKNLKLYFIVDPDIPHALEGDAMRIRQVIINLANNAIKFTQEGSVGVTVTCENKGEDEVSLTFHIKDTGIGIMEEDVEKIFTSFQQVDSRRNRSVEGTGLGLAISKRLVEAMGGSIGLETKYGEGSDFWFTIPQKVLDPQPDIKITDQFWRRGLVINDDPPRVGLFKDILENIGMSVEIMTDTGGYRPATGYKDYLFFDYRRYTEGIHEFLEDNPDVTGIALIEFNSSFKSDLPNLRTLRRPVATPKIERLLFEDKETDGPAFDVEEAYSANFTAPNAKILIVDDNEINIAITEGLLSLLNMNVDSAMSGKEAIDKIGREDYDIVLMDHMMPEMDGVDATKIIRRTKSEDELVIIALSANAIAEAQKMFLESGMNDFVAKPIDIKVLVSKIKKWLPEEKIVKGSQ